MGRQAERVLGLDLSIAGCGVWGAVRVTWVCLKTVHLARVGWDGRGQAVTAWEGLVGG